MRNLTIPEYHELPEGALYDEGDDVPRFKERYGLPPMDSRAYEERDVHALLGKVFAALALVK